MKRRSFQEWLDLRYGPAFQRPPDPRDVPPGVSRAERQARTALRWYSPSWREVHGEELVGTVLDAAAASRRGRHADAPLPLRVHFDLARGGRLQRRRARPSHRDRSRLLQGWGITEWGQLAWLRDRLDQRGALWFQVNFMLSMCLFWSLLITVSPTSHDSIRARLLLAPLLLSGYVLFAAICVYFAPMVYGRRRAIRRARLSEAGWPIAWNPPPPWFVPQKAPLPPSGTDLGPPITS